MRLLTRQQAAAYCGLSLPSFLTVCTVPVLALGTGKRLERYDIRDLDSWIDDFKAGQHSGHVNWLELIGK